MNVTTLNYGSILCMNVKDVKADKDDYTMSLPIQVLKVLNADKSIVASRSNMCRYFFNCWKLLRVS
jgi:hypothetical protein